MIKSEICDCKDIHHTSYDGIHHRHSYDQRVHTDNHIRKNGENV